MSSAPRRALIVIDVQNEYVTGRLPIEYPPVEISLANIGRAIDGAHAHQIPVIVVQQDGPAGAPFAKGSPLWELHPVVASRACDHHVHKTLPSPFPETDLQSWLTAHQIDTLSVVGYMTHNCDASTIVHALHLGLTVEFLADASGAVPYKNEAGEASAEEIHRVYGVVFHSRFAAVTSTAQWLKAVADQCPLTRDNIAASNLRARESRTAIGT